MRDRGASHAWRQRALLIGLVLGALVVLGRAVQLQVLQGERWEARALDQQRRRVELPAPRGTIYDRNGVPLATSREASRIAVAPREVQDAEEVARRLREVLGLSNAEVARALNPARRWVVLPGRYDAAVRQRLEGVRGVYFERVVERVYPHGALAREILGGVSPEGVAMGGIEQEYDSLLAGRPGIAVSRRNARGEVIPGSLVVVAEPVAGSDVYLTLDIHLQEIADEVLREAMAETGAEGGDILFTDPRTGEVLAAVSRRAEGGSHWRGVTEPYEPGSTLKPFLVAMLLAEGRATLEDSVYAEEGRWESEGRTLTDSNKHGWLTVRDALRVSSNIAMAKLAERVEPREQYAYLRDFGFGAPTGVSYPSEAAGRLRRPSEWSRYSRASLAIGYEIAVTPLQMVMAYGAVANGGVLLEPVLVREVRTREGERRVTAAVRPIRRVIPEEVARAVGSALVEVVETGTGREAGLGAFRVAGKTGTARRSVGGRYEPGAYTASFAGYFPAEDPQLAFLVKLDRPRGAYYGGLAAAPVTRATLAAALAARNTVLDRRAVAASLEERRATESKERGRQEVAVPRDGEEAEAPWHPPVSGPFIFALEGAPPRRFAPADPDSARVVPDVRGQPMRDAVRRLHAAGFVVEVEGSGAVRRTVPSGGTRAVPGTVVHVVGAREGA